MLDTLQVFLNIIRVICQTSSLMKADTVKLMISTMGSCLFNSKRRPCGNHFYIFNVVRNEFECNTYVFY